MECKTTAKMPKKNIAKTPKKILPKRRKNDIIYAEVKLNERI